MIRLRAVKPGTRGVETFDVVINPANISTIESLPIGSTGKSQVVMVNGHGYEVMQSVDEINDLIQR